MDKKKKIRSDIGIKMLYESDIQQVIDRVVKAEHPKQIILFGSYARGEQTRESDLDIIVVFDSIFQKGKKMAEIRNAIGRVAPGIGIDILVSNTTEMDNPLPGSALYWGLHEGKVVYAEEG